MSICGSGSELGCEWADVCYDEPTIHSDDELDSQLDSDSDGDVF